MAEPRRILRLQQLILETLATAIQTHVDDPRVKGVTVTRVKLSKDMSRGLVFWSNLEPGGPRRTCERGLVDALPYLQALVAGAMTTRLTPALTFKFDEGLERANRIGDIFGRLARERGEDPEAATILPPEGSGPPAAPGADEEDADDEDPDDEDPDDVAEAAAADRDAEDDASAGDDEDDDEPEDPAG